MKKLMLVIFLILLLAGSFLLGSWYRQQENVKPTPSGRKPLQVNTDKGSGTSTDTNTDPDTATHSDTTSMSPGAVKISPEKQQLIGVRLGVVEKKPVALTLRTLGRVAADETRIYRINAAVDGWIRKTFDNATGSVVKKDELMATFYSPDFLGAQQAYIYALNSLGRFQASGKEVPAQISLTKANIQHYQDALHNLGMGDLQVEEIGRTLLYTENINITAPITGFILARNITQGERFDKGKELYRLADLSHVWIMVDIFENEAYDLAPGAKVRVSLPQRKKVLQATVSRVLPLFDGVSRTLKVRLEADNPGYLLRPDMFVDVELPFTLPSAMTVPADAILDSGLKKTVFVDRGNGLFEPREVETGWRVGNRVEIVRGLTPGERIVFSGNFLVDSESKLETAAAGMYGTLVKDPVCGMDVSVNKAEKAGRRIKTNNTVYYFCSEECKEQFQKNPERNVKSKDD